MADLGRCTACDRAGSGIALDGLPYCDRCADRQLAAVTGWQALPDPPPPEIIIGPDRRRHFMRYRLIRMPTAILALAEELGPASGSGYRLELHCNHFSDPQLLLPKIPEEAHAAIAHRYLTNKHGGWSLTGYELGGRLEEDMDDFDGLPRVVVDGYSLSWEELGMLLKPYVGRSFELRLGDEPAFRGQGAKPAGITVRPPTGAEQRAAERALRRTAGGYFLDSAYYPRPEEWTRGRRTIEESNFRSSRAASCVRQPEEADAVVTSPVSPVSLVLVRSPR
jgi:hypothetical protein